MYHYERMPAFLSALAVNTVQFPALSSLSLYTVVTAYELVFAALNNTFS